MEINFFGNRLTDRTTKVLSRVMDFRSANQKIISENLANADTPGFRPKQLRFDMELQRAVDKNSLDLKTTNPGHLPVSSFLDKGRDIFPVEEKAAGNPGSDELNLDEEMAKMMQNNLLYEASAKLLTNKLRALRNVIEGIRR